MVQFLVKDSSTESTEGLYRILLYTFNNKGDKFFAGIKPADLYKNREILDKIKWYVNLMTKFNIYIDAILERREVNTMNEAVYLIVDTELDKKLDN